MINFDEKTHTYTNEFGKVLISVSTIIHLYSKPFDPTGEITKRCAERNGISVEEMKAEWEKEKNDANIRGKSFHSQAEHWIKTGEILDEDYKDVVKQLTMMKFKGKLYSEQIVYSNKLMIAGTIDLVEDLGDNFLKLYDFKTNKELKSRGFFDRKSGEYSRMLYPVSHLEDCNWVHYCLQLSGYQILQEELGNHIINKQLIYVNPKSRKLEIYDVPDLREEFFSIVNHFLSIKI